MKNINERILELLKTKDGLTDREITDALIGKGAPQQPINQACRDLESKGFIIRSKEAGRIRNYLANNNSNTNINPQERNEDMETELSSSEDMLKKHLEKWLTVNGWKVQIAWSHQQGIDILANQGNKRWVIEVKGEGSRQAMRVNYFLAILGETLQRMDDPGSEYSIALPDLQQYRNLWYRLPQLAKQRTGISILFVDHNGEITQQK